MSSATPFRLRILTALLATTAPITAAWAEDAAENPRTPLEAPPPSSWAAATAANAGPSAPASAETEGIEDVIVTAQRRSEKLQKVPIAVTPISPSEIATAGVSSSLDLPRLAPGMTTSPNSANAFFIPYIRGAGSNSPATGNDSSIAVYIDGVYQSDKSANVFDFNDIERIEVLKGPQGTLYGRNATGGAINIVTLQPKDELSGNAEFSYERFDSWTLKGYLTGPLTHTLSASVAYKHSGGGDYLTNTGPIKPGSFGGTKNDSVDAKLRFKPDSAFQATASFMYVNRRTDDLGSNLYPVPGTTPVGVLLGGTADYGLYKYAGSPNSFRTESYRATLKATYSLDTFDIASITGYVHTTDYTRLDFDGTSANVLGFDEYQGTSDFSQELQLLSSSESPLQWVLGGYYFDGTARINPLNLQQGVPYYATISGAASFPAGGSITSIDARGPTRALAAYGQATYAITDSTRLTAGLRYTSERRAYTFKLFGVGQIAPGFFSPAPIELLSDDGNLHKVFNKPTWRLAVDQQISPDVMAYASWNRGFKSGTYNLNDFTPNQSPVQPEQLDAYELGLKSQLFDHKLQLNVAGFYYNYKNIQLDTIVASGSGANATVLQNAASERNYGIDLDMIVQPMPALQLRWSGSWLNAKYRKYPRATAFLPDAFGNGTQSLVDASGQRGLFAPEWSFNIGADYTFSLADGSNFLLSASYFRTAAFKVDIGPLDRTDEYDSLGMSLTYTLPNDHYYARVYGNNLTNQKVIGTSLSALKQSRDEIRPITFGVAIGVHF